MIRRLPPSATVLRNIPVPQQYLVALTCGEVVQRLRPARVSGSPGARIAAGDALVATAIALICWSLYATRSVDLEHPDRLVTSGPYALSRNPMYVAWAALAVGAGLLRNSMWILASAPIGARFVHRAVLKEEHDLAVRHPEQFPKYAAAVPRYLLASCRPKSRRISITQTRHRRVMPPALIGIDRCNHLTVKLRKRTTR